MIWIIIVEFVLFWLLCGYLAFGRIVGHVAFQKNKELLETNRSDYCKVLFFLCIPGPLSLMLTYFCHGKTMWKVNFIDK